MELRPHTHDLIRLVDVDTGDTVLEGELALPANPRGIVAFVHGSGSSRHSPRNKQVARSLRTTANVGTLLFDLLTEREADIDMETGRLRFDVELLARRVVAATDWLLRLPDTRSLSIGYFGASTGAAAAIVAAGERSDDVDAIVSRGGRPDLAGAEALARVRAPTLFVVGGEDAVVLDLNRAACASMKAPVKLEVVPGAGHLFEEPGALGQVADRASKWFEKWLGGKRIKDG